MNIYATDITFTKSSFNDPRHSIRASQVTEDLEFSMNFFENSNAD